jgi:SET domain-containing protein
MISRWALCGCSCDGGNLAVDVLRSRGDLLPRVAFFAAQDIDSGVELTFAYGMPSGAADGPEVAQRCLCNTASCLGWLPRGGR